MGLEPGIALSFAVIKVFGFFPKKFHLVEDLLRQVAFRNQVVLKLDTSQHDEWNFSSLNYLTNHGRFESFFVFCQRTWQSIYEVDV